MARDIVAEELDAEMAAPKRGPGRPRRDDGMVREPVRRSVSRRPSDAEILADPELIEADEGDPFAIPDDLVPEGMVYEWKRFDCLGMSQAHEIVSLRRVGWREVPNGRHKGDFPMMPSDTPDDAPIMRNGLCLMELPDEMHYRKKRYLELKAGVQVRTKEQEFLSTQPGQARRVGALGRGQGIRKEMRMATMVGE